MCYFAYREFNMEGEELPISAPDGMKKKTKQGDG